MLLRYYELPDRQQKLGLSPSVRMKEAWPYTPVSHTEGGVAYVSQNKAKGGVAWIPFSPT